MLLRPRVLIVEDDAAMGEALLTTLSIAGYDADIARTGTEGVEKLLEGNQYDLLLLDLILPGVDGLGVLGRVRQTPAIAHLPVIMLTARSDEDSEIEVLAAGADDYIPKPFSFENLIAHIEALLRRSALRDSNPLTGLPGNRPVERFLKRCAREHSYFWAAAYVDIDNFKAYNDCYGFLQGDDVLRATGEVLSAAAKSYPHEVLIGHIGGDDFLLGFSKNAPRTDESAADEVDAVLGRVIEGFADVVGQFYGESDAARGYIEAEGRTGKVERHSLMALSVAVVTNSRRVFQHPLEISSTFVALKHKAKTISGSAICYDQRRR
jgi:DNA-binding response OmpR family regulator